MLGMVAALSGALAVAAGAFGAHGVEGKAAEWLRTGGQYQLIHPHRHQRRDRMDQLILAAGWVWMAWSLRG